MHFNNSIKTESSIKKKEKLREKQIEENTLS